VGGTLLGFGRVATVEEKHAEARRLLMRWLIEYREIHVDAPGAAVAEALEASAQLFAAERKGEQAARLWGAAEALREAIGAPWSPIEPEEEKREVTESRQAFGAEAFAAAWAAGRAMTAEQAITYALEESGV